MSSPAKIDPAFSGVNETLLITLWCRAIDAASPNPVLDDPVARKTMDRIDYDFSSLPVSAVQSQYFAARGALFDRWATRFIEQHCLPPRHDEGGGEGAEDEDEVKGRCTVVHLGCGLDSRYVRVVGKLAAAHPDLESRVRWVDVDLPNVATVRAQVTDPPGPQCDYTLLGADVLATGSPDPSVPSSEPSSIVPSPPSPAATTKTGGGNMSWLERVPADRPTIVLAEGLLMYLPAEAVPRFLERLVRHFSAEGHRGRIGFDTVCRWLLWAQRGFGIIRRTGAVMHWGIDDGEELVGIGGRRREGGDGVEGEGQGEGNGKGEGGLVLLEGGSVTECEEYWKAHDWLGKLTLGILAWVPFLRHAGRALLYEFGA